MLIGVLHLADVSVWTQQRLRVDRLIVDVRRTAPVNYSISTQRFAYQISQINRRIAAIYFLQTKQQLLSKIPLLYTTGLADIRSGASELRGRPHII